MRGVLEEVDRSYGGAESYLRRAGLSESELDAPASGYGDDSACRLRPDGIRQDRRRRGIAERIPAEVVSADSMQVYRGLPILTAQPERPTQLVAIWELDHEASVVEYQTLAHRAVDEALEHGRRRRRGWHRPLPPRRASRT